MQKKILLGFLLILIVGATLFANYYPHYYALIKTPEEYSFSGQASWFDPWDINNYFATIRVSQKDKKMFLENLNTTEIIKPTFVYPLYTLAGIAFPKADPIFLYHSLAIIIGLGLMITMFLLAQMLLKNSFYSLYVLLLASLGGGFGFLFSSAGKSADLSIPGVTFLSTFQKPHEALAAILYLTSLVLFFLALKNKKISLLAISILSLSFLIPIYPYRLLSFALITGIYCFKTGKKYPFLYLGTLVVATAPIAFLYVFHFLSSGFSVLTSYQPSPISLISLLLGYGAFAILFVCQLFFPIKNRPLAVFLNIWIIVSLILSILPFGMGRLFLSGLLFPLAIVSALVAGNLANRFKVPGLFLILLLGFLPSSLYIFNKRINETANNNVWFYLPQTIKEGVEFLKEQKEDGVLALPPLTSYIPALAGKHVYFGLQDQTPDYPNRVNRASLFYQGKLSVEEAKLFLEQNQIHFVVS
ncbi:MAG: hypothetical protein ABID04_03115, partial [Patescibacteria group bacterium]